VLSAHTSTDVWWESIPIFRSIWWPFEAIDVSWCTFVPSWWGDLVRSVWFWSYMGHVRSLDLVVNFLLQLRHYLGLYRRFCFWSQSMLSRTSWKSYPQVSGSHVLSIVHFSTGFRSCRSQDIIPSCNYTTDFTSYSVTSYSKIDSNLNSALD